MNINFSAPSKTFLAGEYAVLKGAPALVLCTAPRFGMRAVKGEPGVSGIPAGSPAAKWLERHSALLSDWKIDFSDPHAGQGGFGASGAQFLFAHALTSLLQISVSRAIAGLDLKALLSDFKESSCGQGSGADLLAQAAGRVSLVHSGSAEAADWPFPELEFAILRTGNKVATHTHLAELDHSQLEELIAPANLVAERFVSGSVEKFLHSVKAYGQMLRELHLQAPTTLKLLASFDDQPWCKAAKGCGALGADTLLVFFAREDREQAEGHIRTLKLERVEAPLSEGLAMNWNWA